MSNDFYKDYGDEGFLRNLNAQQFVEFFFGMSVLLWQDVHAIVVAKPKSIAEFHSYDILRTAFVQSTKANKNIAETNYTVALKIFGKGKIAKQVRLVSTIMQEIASKLYSIETDRDFVSLRKNSTELKKAIITLLKLNHQEHPTEKKGK